MNIKFTEIFNDLLIDSELTKTQFAKKINVSPSKINGYQNGLIPAPKTVAKICDYFGCSMDYITGLSNEISYPNMKNGYYPECFMVEYQKLLDINNTKHYRLSQKGIVNMTCLIRWKNGRLPMFEVIYNIANELGGSIDKLLGRI